VKFLPIALLGACALAVPAQAPAGADSAAIERDGLRQLLAIRRVYVDRLTGGETAAQMRDILISALDGAKLFVLTENQEHADFTLRGAAEDLVFTEEHSSSDGVNIRADVGTGRASSRSTGEHAGIGVGDSESDRSAERRHEAIAAVRLVNQAGDVIWSTTQESQGAKFRGASADVADKITAKLKEDFEKARKLEP
jgi:hypothetical protein